MAANENRVGKKSFSNWEARAAAVLPIAGAGLVALSLLLPHPSGGDETALLLTAAAMAFVGIVAMAFVGRLPRPVVHALIAATVAVTGLLIYEAGAAVGQYGTIWVWATLISSYFFPRRVAVVHLAWLLAVYAVALLFVENTAGYSPLTRWLFTLISLSVVMLLITSVVSAQARADKRARRFFELSHDMLCTMDGEGRCREVNGAWTRHLGYSAEELRGTRLLDLTHPDDHEQAMAEALSLFKTGSSSSLETRVRAKDGSWHWLRTSSTLAKDEGLVYARSTDVTQLKLIEAEREKLLGEVQDLARHDALTGLPNRRVLQELLPREMARARRAESPLCLAIIDIDHFKQYNDSHGHLAGDEVLRACAREWDEALRGEDTLVRFGGEEFLVLLPDTEPEQATEIVERLRAKTPMGQTCSAGLALWDHGESIDDLLRRADDALYLAKASGRDQLAQAQLTQS
ncbi:MAG TPA: sensor domain-containing diguanylate cyclase [Solirubrobacterales bacterium]|nr:sensor domain-containing diguanylate cyclase [Solirubrobacterales bacterium]